MTFDARKQNYQFNFLILSDSHVNSVKMTKRIELIFGTETSPSLDYIVLESLAKVRVFTESLSNKRTAVAEIVIVKVLQE